MKSREGFTLLELLLAVTIFSVIAVALIATFNAGIKILRRSEESMRQHQDLRYALDEVALDLRNALLAELPQAEAETEEIEGEEEEVYYFSGSSTGFDFMTLKDVYDEDKIKREVCRVRYFLREGAPLKFVRSVSSASAGYASGADANEELISDIIKSVEVSYAFEPHDEDMPPEWHDNWEMPEAIPAGVKIRFDLKGVGTLQNITKTVFIETGVLGSFKESEGGI